MKRLGWSIILALLLLGCTASTPKQPTTLGITITDVGPGLVIEGQTPLPELHIALQSGDKVIQQADVTPKDDGWYRVTWPRPQASAEVVISSKGKALLKAPVPTGDNPSRFYGPNASGMSLMVVDPKAMTTLMLNGQVRAKDGKVWVELRDGAKTLATHTFTLEKAAPAFGDLATKVPMAPGATTVWILTNEGKQPEVAIPIIVR